MSPRARLASVYKMAESIDPSRPISRFSFIKVENVVKPPQERRDRFSLRECGDAILFQIEYE